jgi:hypothetical protein
MECISRAETLSLSDFKAFLFVSEGKPHEDVAQFLRAQHIHCIRIPMAHTARRAREAHTRVHPRLESLASRDVVVRGAVTCSLHNPDCTDHTLHKSSSSIMH